LDIADQLRPGCHERALADPNAPAPERMRLQNGEA
jgi:hypothetical protein